MLKINPEIIYTPGSVVTDQNASSKYAQFNEPADGLSVFNCKLVYAENWTDDDYFAYLKKGTIVDSTIIAAPTSTKNKERKRDSDAHQTRKGNT